MNKYVETMEELVKPLAEDIGKWFGDDFIEYNKVNKSDGKPITNNVRSFDIIEPDGYPHE